MMRTLAVVSLLHIFDQAAAGVPDAEPPVNDESYNKCMQHAVCEQMAAADTDMAELQNKIEIEKDMDEKKDMDEIEKRERRMNRVDQASVAKEACMYDFWTGYCLEAEDNLAWENLNPEQRQLQSACALAAARCTLKTPEDGNVAARIKGSPPATKLAPADEAGSTVVV